MLLSRHGESEYNKRNLFTGWTDCDITDKGRKEAVEVGRRLKDAGYMHIDCAFTSELKRAQHSLEIELDQLGLNNKVLIEKTQTLNERDYGALTGLNKDDARHKWGKEQVHIWRRSYSVAPPEGESLEMTGERVLPFYFCRILPLVEQGKTVLVSAHGNSLRSMIKELLGLTPEECVDIQPLTRPTDR